MADKKISALTGATTPLAGTEVLPIVQGGSTVKVSVADLTVGRAVTGLSYLANTGRSGATQAQDIQISRTSSTGSVLTGPNIYFDDGTANNTIAVQNGAGYFQVFGYNGSWLELLKVNNSGNVTAPIGNLVVGTAGKGIDFSANGGDVLSQYDEGTWTPVIVGSSSAGTGNYPVQVGRYTRVGNLVHVQMFLLWDSHTGTGNMDIGGLPFTSSNTAFNFAGVAIGQFENIALTALNMPMAHIAANSTQISLRQVPVGGGAMATIPLDTAGDIILSASYQI